MTTRAMMSVCAVMSLMIPAVATAQTDLATDVLKADIEAVLKSPDGGVDRQISVVDIGKLNVAVGVLHRGPTRDNAGPTTAIEHTQVTEVYYVLSGSGTLITGTAVVDREQISPGSEIVQVAVGPSARATFQEQGNQVREISSGDVVVIPAGVFHGWRDIEDHVTYLSIRPDPDRVLPAGYLNPAITN